VSYPLRSLYDSRFISMTIGTINERSCPKTMGTRENTRNAAIYVLVLLVFGVAVPRAKGLGFFDPALLSAYACLGTVFAGPIAAKAFEGRPASLGQALGWIARAALFGEAIAAAMLACGIATVFVLNRAAFFPPDLESLAYSMLLGLAGCFALASLAGWVTVQFSAGVARMAMRTVFVGLLALMYLHGQSLPDVTGAGILISTMVSIAFVLLLRRSLKNLTSRTP
jgi:hypothetical protein